MELSALPLSELGRCTGRFYLDERRPIIVMRCYFDGSEGEDDSGSQWLTLAGYIASDSFWGGFQGKWETMLKERYPIAPYLHMWELISGKDPFDRANGWTENKVEALIGDAVHLLQGLNKRAFCSFVCSIDLAAQQRLLAEGNSIPPNPYDVVAAGCVQGAFSWYFKEHPTNIEIAYVFFDRDEQFIKEFRKAWRKRCPPKDKVAPYPFWGLIREVQEVDMRNNPPIQAADLLAWARTRSLSDKERPHRFLDPIIKTLIPQDAVRMDEAYMRLLIKRKPASGLIEMP